MAIMKSKYIIIKLTILGYELSSKENAVFNHLIPCIFGCIFYVTHFSIDLGVALRHSIDDNPIWSNLTIFFIILPAIGCFIMNISSVELWPEYEGCSKKNTRWLILKIFEHCFFPVWSMWRFAERLFWSIEAVKSIDEESLEYALKQASTPRSIEFYFFLQGYVQAIPQVLLQLHILMRYVSKKMSLETVFFQTASIMLNITYMAFITVLYQRFKSQNLGGRMYPWFKPHKYMYDPSIDEVDSSNGQQNRKSFKTKSRIQTASFVYATRNNYDELKRQLEMEEIEPINFPGGDSTSDNSSLCYLEPIEVTTVDSTDITDNVLRTSLAKENVDFPKPVRLVWALPEDDLVGKIISFLWWFTFLVGRFLAISMFGFFYSKDIIWILSCHFIICVALLIYDVQSYVVRRTKAIFFILIGLIYLFCVIEFKKRFKKPMLIYCGYFTLTFSENIIMCIIWWCNKLEDTFDDWWYRYTFYLIMASTILSVSSMLFYQIINKPKEILVGEEVI